MNRQMRRLVEREERRQKKQSQDKRPSARAERAVTPRKRPVAQRPPFPTRLMIFLREVRTELSRVSWPTRRQLVNFSVVTITTSVILALVIFGLDVALKQIVLTLLGGIGSG